MPERLPHSTLRQQGEVTELHPNTMTQRTRERQRPSHLSPVDINGQREAFIPYRRADIINLCLAEELLDPKATEEFRSFCQILVAYYHYQFHDDLEAIKDNYIVFNPNTDVQPLYEPTLQEYEQMETNVVQSFQHILERANYCPMPEETIHKALVNRALINLKTEVDFDDFDQFLCYYRGDVDTVVPAKKLFFWKTQKTVDTLERLVLLMKFKGKGYFRAKRNRTKGNAEDLKFTPGKMYVYFYKNIPKLDLDLLFPNIRTWMTWRDRLLLVVPAIAAAVPVIFKALPNLLVLIAAVLLLLNVYPHPTLQALNVDAEQARDVMPVLIATLSLVIALGGFAAKQYSQYKNKKIKFQKDVTDTLYFKSLATNASVFQMLVDLAEEEECKEIILVYYHLLTCSELLTPERLDTNIETWLIEKTGTHIDFDIQGPLQNLQNLRGCLGSDQEIPLLDYDDKGCCRVLPLREARAVLDYVWDHAFEYKMESTVDGARSWL